MGGVRSDGSDETLTASLMLVRGRGQRLTLRVKPDGIIAVRAPQWVPKNHIDNFLRLKKGWIREQQEKYERLYGFDDGKLTDNTRIKLIPSTTREGVAETDTTLVLYYPARQAKPLPWAAYERLRPAIKSRLAEEARQYIPDQVEYIADRFNLKHGDIRLRFVRSRWGSCNTRRDLMFNTQIMRLPASLREYIICHELAHTRHLHHGGEFHALLSKLLPDAKLRSRLLAKQQILQ